MRYAYQTLKIAIVHTVRNFRLVKCEETTKEDGLVFSLNENGFVGGIKFKVENLKEEWSKQMIWALIERITLFVTVYALLAPLSTVLFTQTTKFRWEQQIYSMFSVHYINNLMNINKLNITIIRLL